MRAKVPKSDSIEDSGMVMPKWMLSVPETLTPEELSDRKAWVAALYPDDVIQDIVKAAGPRATVNLKILRSFLVEAGCMFIDQKNDRHARASFAPDKAQLTKIANYADMLETALANLSDVSARSLWHPFHHLTMLHAPTGTESCVTEFGLAINKYKQADGSVMIQHLRPHQIEEAIHVLRCLAEGAAASLPKQSGGQPQYGARLSWIISAQNYWRHHSTLAFDARSAAYNFCFQAFKPLDANVTEQQIASAIRAANKLVPIGVRHLSKGRARIKKS